MTNHSTGVAPIAHYLDTHNVLNLASQGADGPWVAAVFFVREDARLYFLSAPHTRHIKNILIDSRVAGTIQREVDDWQAIRGVQLQGSVDAVPDSQRSHVIECYANKFTVTGPDAPAPIAKALHKVGWYTLTIDTLFFIDNSQGLGHRETIDLSDLVAN